MGTHRQPSLHSVHPSSLSCQTSSTMAPIAGKYLLDSSENFDEFMKTLGVGMMLRKLGGSSKPLVDLSQTDDEWLMKTSTTLKNTEIKFKLGVEISETTFDMEGDDKLVQIQKAAKGKDCKFVRQFTDTEMIMTSECEGVVSKRIYKRQ